MSPPEEQRLCTNQLSHIMVSWAMTRKQPSQLASQPGFTCPFLDLMASGSGTPCYKVQAQKLFIG
jgi:hypothetical protein